MRTANRAPGLAPGDILNQALIRTFPAKTLPYTQGAIIRLVDGVLALQAKNDPTSVETTKEGVNVPDLQETLKLSPTLQVTIEVRDAVFSLTFSAIPSDSALVRASSGRIERVQISASPAPAETAPLTLDGKSQEAVESLLGKLKNHPRIGEIPPTLQNVLCERLLSFCQGNAAKESFDLPEMLWERLQPKDAKWIVQVNTMAGQIGAEVTLTKVEKYNKGSKVGEDGKTKQTSEDVSFVRVGFWKWKEEEKEKVS